MESKDYKLKLFQQYPKDRDFLEEQELIINLGETTDKDLKKCIEKAIDCKNAWNVINSNWKLTELTLNLQKEISRQNNGLQIRMIILTIILALWTIIQSIPVIQKLIGKY